MDLRRLRLFLAVVDGGGMTRAAEAEHVSQPSVSQAIRELETELGTPLFHRVGRGVVLTPAGEALVEPARQVLRDLDTGRAAVEAVAGLTAGRLDLVALPTLAADPVAPLVGAFRVDHPGIDIALADPADATELVDLVASGACEIGITAEPVVDSSLTSHALVHQDLLAVLPPGSNSSHTMAVTTLARLPLVAAPAGTTTRTQLEDAFAEAHVTPRIAVVTAQREAILPLVLAGAGATLFPRPLAEQAAALGAVVVALRPRLTRPVHLFHRAGPLSPAAAAFRELALG
ncbi:MAG TPA: LysR substrate-binding domain-containing protein [Acidimicrobiia bacterium]|jgi:DNA-binding transcriptional LysR family regulator